MAELIITEKPSAAKKIADNLADSKPKKISENGVPYYTLHHDGKEIIVVCAVGHLFTVAEKEKSFKYPSFDIEWTPSHKSSKTAAFSKKYLNVIKKVAKQADSYTVACDYDIEGEVIGYNIVRFLCNQKDANRMKFSTLMKEDVIKAYKNKSQTIDWGQAKAGETRHFLDWLYGINISRALTLSIKNSGRFKIMSTGRVQGPALKIIVDREKEIKDFKPVPYWQISMVTSKNKTMIKTLHSQDKFWDKQKVDEVYNKIKDSKQTILKDLSSRQFKQAAPNPFDLGSLQSEAYSLFKINPKQTLQIAQDLYLKGLTSYPRTSSQQLPKEIGYRKILGELSKNPEYQVLTSKLLEKSDLKPNNGKKTDPAHPAIYPTGLRGNLEGRDKKVYDLIVKRFFATFCEAAVRETMTLNFDIKSEIFLAKGTKTIKRGWHDFYMPYVKFKDEELPELVKGEELPVKSISLDEKQTEPPKRYTPASLVSELEKRGLGTKATRADIVQSLFDRGYLNEKSIQATELGILLIDVLEKYIPDIVDEALTKEIEDEMEKIREKKLTPEQILDRAKDFLIKVLDKFKKHEKEIGSVFVEANKEDIDNATNLGKCVKCGEGNLKIRKGKYGMFVACDKYPDCKTTFSIPKGVMIKPADKVSSTGYPVVTVIARGKQPQELSINPQDNIPEDKKELIERLEKEGYTKDGVELKLRYGFYGPFLAAKNYPKEKMILSLDEVKLD
ncbi:MAG: DNA topoisomerase I [Candidatus Woesearchaeota archaeon]